MSGRRLVVVRPQPGNDRTAAAARARGWTVEQMPLFGFVAVDWSPPDPAGHDALLLTSANTVRMAGHGLARLAHLPVVAVGAATAAAARAAGLNLALTGDADAAAAVRAARAAGYARPLHLAGRDRIEQPGVTAITVYASEALFPPADAAARLAGAVVALHSPRIARVVAALAVDRRATAIAAISTAVRDAAGGDWRAAAVAAVPTDAALLDAASSIAATLDD